MAAAGVASEGGATSAVDKDRLPWLADYREPEPHHGLGWAGAALGVLAVTAVGGGLYLATAPNPSDDPAPIVASVQQRPVATPVTTAAPSPVDVALADPAPSPKPRARNVSRSRPVEVRIHRGIHSADGERDRFDAVMASQDEAAGGVAADKAMADRLAAIPAQSQYQLDHPSVPPRPAVDPAARVQRRQTIRMGVYLTANQAELAWKAAVRDYTYLVTMPKQVAPVTYRGRRYWQLNLGTPSRTHAMQLCRNLKSIGHACSVA